MPGWYLWPATRPRSTAIRMNCGRHGFYPPCARERGSAAGHQCLARLAQGTVCKLLGQEEFKPHKVRYYLETPRRRVRAQEMAEVLVCSPRGPGPEKSRCQGGRNRRSRSRSSPTTRSQSRPSPRRHRICRQCQAAMRASRGIMEYKRHGTLSLLAGIDLLTGKVHALVRERHRSREFIEFLSFSMPPIRPAPRSS